MNFNADTLAQARKQGISDDQIFSVLSEGDQRFGKAKEAGLSLDQVAEYLQSTNTKSQPGAPTDQHPIRGEGFKPTARYDVNQPVAQQQPQVSTASMSSPLEVPVANISGYSVPLSDDASMLEAINKTRANEGKRPYKSLGEVKNPADDEIEKIQSRGMSVLMSGFETWAGKETPQFKIDPNELPGTAVAKSAANNIMQLIDFAISPAGLATAELGTMARAGSTLAKVGTRVIAGKFAYDLAKSGGEQLAEATDPNATMGQKAAAYTNAILAFVGGFLSARHMASRKPAKEGEQIRQEADQKLKEDLQQIPKEYLEEFVNNKQIADKLEYDPTIINEVIDSKLAQRTEDEAARGSENRVESRSGEVADTSREITIESKPSEVKPGYIRMYHGGVPIDPSNPTEGRWLTQSKEYAEGYARKHEGSIVHYVDVPENHPALKKTFDDTDLPYKAPYVNFEADEELTRQLKPIEAKQTAPVKSAAIKQEDGSIVTGESHNEILKSQGLPEEPSAEVREQNPNMGFVDEEGNFLSRGEAAQRAQEHQQIEQPVELLHSSDLNEQVDLQSTNPDTKEIIGDLAENARAKLGPGAANAEEFQTILAENKREYASIGADKLFSGITDKSSWKASMLEEFPYAEEKDLNEIWRDSKDLVKGFEEQTTKVKGTTKQIVDLSTGVRDVQRTLKDSVSKAKAFGEYLRGMEKGSALGKAKAEKQLRMADKWMEAEKNRIASQLTDLASQLPTDKQGRVIKAIVRSLQRPDLLKGNYESMAKKAQQAVDIIQGYAERSQRQDLQNTIRSLHSKALESPSVSVNAKEQLRYLLNDISLKTLTPKVAESTLETIREYQAKGKTLTPSMKEALRNIQGTSLKDLSIPELDALKTQIEFLHEMGKHEWKDIKDARRYELQKRETDLQKETTTKPVAEFEKVVREVPAEGLTKIVDSVKNTLGESLNILSTFEKSLLIVPRLFERLDGKTDGWLTKNFLKPLYTFSRKYQLEINKVRSDLNQILDKYKITDEDSKKVGIYSHFAQGFDEGELYIGTKDRATMDRLIKEVRSQGLDARQKALYNFIRQNLDAQIPEMKQFLADNYNTELQLVDNYTPRILDNSKAKEWRAARQKPTFVEEGQTVEQEDALETFKRTMFEGDRKTATAKRGFTKERQPEAQMPVNLDIVDAYAQHMDNWHYVKNFQPHFDMMKKLTSTVTFSDHYGNAGKSLVDSYIDTLARRGKFAKDRAERIIEGVQGRAMRGMLMFRPGQFKHLANYPVGFKEAGGVDMWSNGFLASRTTEGRQFAKLYWPEIFTAFGGDITLKEAQTSAFEKAGFAVDTHLDFTNRIATAMGNYFHQLKDAGYDWKNWQDIAVSEDRINNARIAYNKAIGSPELIDRPLLVSAKIGLISPSYGKAMVAYQMPKLVRWGQMREVATDLRRGNYTKAAGGATMLVASSLLEAGVQMGSKHLMLLGMSGILAALGYKVHQTKKEESAAKEFAYDALKDAVSTPPGGTIASSVVTATQYPRAADKILRKTGIVPLDTTVNMLADGFMAMSKPSKKKTFDTLMSVGEFAGYPLSVPKQLGDEALKEESK